jgi:hypothetical protein
VDSHALGDPSHPGHREAIKAVSHVDPEQHSRLMEWFKKELDQTTRTSGYGPHEG